MNQTDATQRVLTSPELTGAWEHELTRIARGEADPARFRVAVKEFAAAIVAPLKDGALTGLGPCPFCGAPVIVGSKGGYGCSAWKSGCLFRFHGEQFGIKLTEGHVIQLLSRGRLARPRKLTSSDGTTEQGYLAMGSDGVFSVLSREDKLERESFGTCPNCGGLVMEERNGWRCGDCELAVWKKIAGRTISPKMAQFLLSGRQSKKMEGFRSKAGKRFSASLVLRGEKVEMVF